MANDLTKLGPADPARVDASNGVLDHITGTHAASAILHMRRAAVTGERDHADRVARLPAGAQHVEHMLVACRAGAALAIPKTPPLGAALTC